MIMNPSTRLRTGLAAFLAALLLLGGPALAADKPLVIESGQIKQLPSATSLQLQAPTTANATVNLPHGTAPSSPTNGDCWTTTVALYCRINGATASFVGANTGDQTITLTGDATGSGTGSFATTLATVNATTGTFGSATKSLTIAANGKGLITSIAEQTVTPAVGSITGLGTGVGTALAINVGSAGAPVTFNGALGTPSSGTLTNATGLPIAGLTASTSTAIGVGSIELGHASDTTIARSGAGDISVEGNGIYRAGGTDVAVADGGTGLSSYAIGDIPYASAATTIAKLADVATGNVIISGGVTTAPSWGKVGLTTHVSGILPTANGGVDQAAWASWTPTWTNVTIGNGTVTAKYVQIGKTVFARLSLVFGTTTSVSGLIEFTLPATRATYGGSIGTMLGTVRCYDVSAGATFEGHLSTISTTVAAVLTMSVSGTQITHVNTSATVPIPWANTDELLIQFEYEAA